MSQNTNQNKYDLCIFPNGRVYFLPWEDYENAIKQEKSILIICNSWSGGYAIEKWAEPYFDEENEGYTLCGDMVKDIELTEADYKKYYKIIITSGEQILMASGEQATSYCGHKFVDFNSRPEGIEDRHIDEEYKHLQFQDLIFTVNDKATIRFLEMGNNPEDLKEKVKCLISYGIINKCSLKYIKG